VNANNTFTQEFILDLQKKNKKWQIYVIIYENLSIDLTKKVTAIKSEPKLLLKLGVIIISPHELPTFAQSPNKLPTRPK
jgi:hypothetical protein